MGVDVIQKTLILRGIFRNESASWARHPDPSQGAVLDAGTITPADYFFEGHGFTSTKSRRDIFILSHQLCHSFQTWNNFETEIAAVRINISPRAEPTSEDGASRPVLLRSDKPPHRRRAAHDFPVSALPRPHPDVTGSVFWSTVSWVEN